MLFRSGEFYPLDIYDKFMKENPVFMISNEETDRMRAQAVERISYLFDAAADQDNHILVKIGLPVDEEHKTRTMSGSIFGLNCWRFPEIAFRRSLRRSPTILKICTKVLF